MLVIWFSQISISFIFKALSNLFVYLQKKVLMSYVKADLRKYLKKYTDGMDELDQVFQQIRKSHNAQEDETRQDQKIKRMEDKINHLLSSEMNKEKQILNLDNRQIIWEERIPKSYLFTPSNEDILEKSEVDGLADRLGRVRLTIKIHLKEIIHLKYNLPLLENYQRISEFNPKLPETMRLVFYIFGERIETNLVQLKGKKIINSDFKKLRMIRPEMIQTVVNFDASRLSQVQRRFLQSDIQVLCIDEYDSILLQGSTKAYNLINNQIVQIGLKSSKNVKRASLHMFVEIEQQKVTKQSEKHHVVNDRVVSVPSDMIQELQFEILNKQRQSPIKRTSYLDRQGFNNLDIKLVQQFKDKVKATKIKAFLAKQRVEKIIEVFCNQPEIIPIPIENSTLKTKTVKLQYEKLPSPYTGQSQLKFVTSDELLREQIAAGTRVPANITYTPFKQLKIKEQILLQIPPEATIIIPMKLSFNQPGQVRYSIIDHPHTFAITDYQSICYEQLNKLLTKQTKPQNQLTIHYGLKFLYHKLPLREDSIKAVRGLWQKLLVPIKNAAESPEKISCKVFPYDVDIQFQFLKSNCEIRLRCFSTQLTQTVAVRVFQEDTLQQIIFVKIQLEDRKAQSEKILRVKPTKKVYQLDISSFTQEDTDYHIKSMKPNYLKILSQNVRFTQQDKQRFIILQLQKIIDRIQVEIIIYDERSFIGTSMNLILVTDKNS